MINDRIDETLERDQTELIEFYASQKGEYEFKCSHFCGIGHLWMNGKVVIEWSAGPAPKTVTSDSTKS